MLRRSATRCHVAVDFGNPPAPARAVLCSLSSMSARPRRSTPADRRREPQAPGGSSRSATASRAPRDRRRRRGRRPGRRQAEPGASRAPHPPATDGQPAVVTSRRHSRRLRHRGTACPAPRSAHAGISAEPLPDTRQGAASRACRKRSKLGVGEYSGGAHCASCSSTNGQLPSSSRRQMAHRSEVCVKSAERFGREVYRLG